MSLNRSAFSRGSTQVTFKNFRVHNVLATTSLPFHLRLEQLASAPAHRAACEYEPELHPFAVYRMEEPKATFQVCNSFQTSFP